jgi:predicted PurR-regulated permease PerM
VFGLLAALLNYMPYIGPALMVLVLFGVGLVTFPSLGQAVVAPLGFVALTTAEGHFITPRIVGRCSTLNPLLVFLALAFWTWMWGPLGAFLAVPLSIILLFVVQHLFPVDDARLPERPELFRFWEFIRTNRHPPYRSKGHDFCLDCFAESS